MDFEGEEQVQALQANLDRMDNQDMDADAQVEDAELVRDLDTEELKRRMDSFTDKQQSMVQKLIALRHKVTVSTNADQVQFQLTQEEERLRTSLKSSKGWRKCQKDDDDSDSADGEAAARLVDSGDESDDFFDRTKKEPQSIFIQRRGPSSSTEQHLSGGAQNTSTSTDALSYQELKAKMEILCNERNLLTEKLH